MSGKVHVVAKLPEPTFTRNDVQELLATLCFYYPQYSYAAAQRMSHRRVLLLVKTAKKIEAKRYYELVQIAAAPHTEKGRGVKELLDRYHEVING